MTKNLFLTIARCDAGLNSLISENNRNLPIDSFVDCRKNAMTESCDKPRISCTAPLPINPDLASDSEDVHYCKRCKQEFTSLHFYLEHKIQHDNFKVIYARSTYDRRVIVPKLVPKESKVSNQPSTNQNIDGKENQQKLPRRGGRGRQKVPDVDEKLITEKTTYTCDKCDKTFHREAALRRHVKYDHTNSDDNEEEEEEVEDGEKDKQTEKEDVENKDDNPEKVAVEDVELDYKSGEIPADGKPSRPYTCQICQRSFKKIIVLRTHMLTHSDKREHHCFFEGCTYAFKTKGSLIRHMRRHTGERPYTCNMCKRSFTESGALSRHLKSRTPCTAKRDSDLPCYGQRWNFIANFPSTMGKIQNTNENTNLQTTDVTNSEEEAFVQQSQTDNVLPMDDSVCEAGDSETTTETSQDNDKCSPVMVEKIDLLKTTQCWVCCEDFSCVNSLRVHLRTHLADMPFRCGLCHFVAEKRQELGRHMLSQHKIELKGPEESLTSCSSILDEGTVQEKEESNLSVVCRNARIAVNQLLKLKKELEPNSPDEEEAKVFTPAEIQGGRPVYKCHVCMRSFRGSAYLRFHLRSHTGERPFKCSECGKAFTTKDMLNKHVSTHSEERNFKCGECGKLFKRISHVQEHLKIHSTMRPYTCSVCDKSFKTSNALKVHLRIHTDVLPYECQFCQRHFREKGSLQRHVRMHTGERPFQCKFCNRSFAEHGTLNRHLKAKVPCIRLAKYKDVTDGTYPTVLAEFSSVVADTQQYIVSEREEKTDSELETAEYVVLHTNLSSDEIIQNVEISANPHDVQHSMLEATGSEETASYIVVSTGSQENNLDMLDIQAVESLILPAEEQVVQQSDIEVSVVNEENEQIVDTNGDCSEDHHVSNIVNNNDNIVDNNENIVDNIENIDQSNDINTVEDLQTVTLVQQAIPTENNEIHAIAVAPQEENTVCVSTSDTIHQAVITVGMVDSCGQEQSLDISTDMMATCSHEQSLDIAADMMDPCNQEQSLDISSIQEVSAMDVDES
uniref:Transcription factor E4F1 n=2 Tax=Octopus bimaculoides TaxID=37653 RepID=A0A0L8HY35_OCTBM